MQLWIFAIIAASISFLDTSSLNKETVHRLKDPKRRNITIHESSKSFKWRQLLKSIKSESDSVHLIFTDASQSPLYESFLNSSNTSHILVCTSVLCLSPCHSCVANTSLTPRANMAAALAVLRHLNVRSVVVFFDETASSTTWSLTGFLSDILPTSHVSIRVDLSRKAIVKQLRRMLRSVVSDSTQMYRHFVVLCSETTTRALLREVSSIAPNNGLLNRQFFWIVLSPIADPTGLVQQLPPFANVLIMRNHRLACSHTQSSIKAAASVACHAECGNNCYHSIRHILRDCSAHAPYVVLMASITTEIGDSGVTEWKEVATYSTASRSLKKRTALFPNTFVDFGGRTLIMGFIPYRPYSIITDRTFMYKNTTCYVLDGYSIDIFNILSQKLNFKSCYVTPDDLLYGDFNEKTGNATGLIGMAYRHEIDFIAEGLIPNPSRARAIDFSFPVESSPYGIMIRRHEPRKSVFQFLYPFDFSIWLVLSCIVMVSGLVIWTLSKLSPCSGVNMQLSTAVTDEVQLQHNVWNSLGYVLEQGQENMPFAVSSRLMTICMWIFCVVMSIEYSANLITLLSLQDTTLPIQSLEDLSNQNEIRLLLQVGDTLDKLFATSKDKAMQMINRNAIRLNGSLFNLIEFMRNSTSKKYAVAFIYNTLRGFEAQECKTFAVLPERFMTDSTVAFAWPKNSFFADKMNALIRGMAETGYFVEFFAKVRQQIYGVPCTRLSDTKSKFSQMDMTELAGLLILFGAFVAAAVLVFLAEAVSRRYRVCLCWSS